MSRHTNFCLWGTRPNDIQVGSPKDRLVQEQLRLAANMQIVLTTLGVALKPLIDGYGKACRGILDAMDLLGARHG